jgi:nucleoside 2-deoxyribosyltransferase
VTYYIATSLARRAEAERLHDLLKARGHEPSFDWTREGDLRGVRGRVGHEKRQALAVRELEGVAAAEAVIVLLPGGRGTYCEIGAALALGKRVVVHGYNAGDLMKGYEYACTFLDHPNVQIAISPSLEELASSL